MMSLSEYVKFVGERLAVAEGKGDKDEVVRLMQLLLETLQDKLKELQSNAHG